MVRSPRFFCSGVSPSQAAKSRPARKPAAAGTSALIAVAVIGPMPCHQSSRDGVFLRALIDFGIQLLDLRLWRGEGTDQYFGSST
jgi:hypothetical protein